MQKQALFQELEQELIEKELSKEELAKLKVKLCGKYEVKKVPTDIEVLLNIKYYDKLKTNLKSKPTRSGSGVAIVAIMAPPKGCPHGKCTFCPGGPGSSFGTVPQSYTGKEPSTLRAIRNDYDPYLIVMNRLEQYIIMGHSPEKIEVIIQGGTFPALKKSFQEEFVTLVFKAMNDFSDLFYTDEKSKNKKGSDENNNNNNNKETEFNLTKFKTFFELPGDKYDDERRKRIHEKMLELKEQKNKKIKNKEQTKEQTTLEEEQTTLEEEQTTLEEEQTTLEEEQTRNETSHIKCVALTIETKPDWGFLEHGNHMLKLGCTRIELGVQSTFDLPLKLTNRGHDINDTIRSLRELKDLGFKINAHYMPGLPGIKDKEEDLEGMRNLFSNPDFRPDMMKVYPCMVFPGTKMYDDWKSGKFNPITTEEAAEIIAKWKRNVPRYCRIMRVQRDIPSFQVEAGVDKTNLRQYVDVICLREGIKCQCIRCREPNPSKPLDKLGDIDINVEEYNASNGKEFFISAENDKYILGLCRLRFPSEQKEQTREEVIERTKEKVTENIREEITFKSALIRELHVYGEAAPIGGDASVQHKGLGRKLMEKAEEIARLHGKDKIVVISGVGVRGYYEKLGYHKEGPYMVKDI